MASTKLTVHEGLIRPSAIRELQDFRCPGHRVSSYLIDLNAERLGSYQAMQVALKDAFDAFDTDVDRLDESHTVKQGLHRDVEVARDAVYRLRGLRGMRSVACFAASECQQLYAFALPWPADTACFFEDRFVTWPLEQLLNQSERFAVCLVDKDDARLFHYFLGQIEEVEKLHHDEPPGEFWYPEAQQHLKYTRRSVQVARHHYQNVADHLFRLSQREPFDHLILGGRPEELGPFEHYLRRALQQRVIARCHVDVRIPVKDLGQRVWDEEQHQLIREAAKLWQELQDTPPRGRAIGPDETLALLHERRAKALLLDPSLIREGGRCLQCHRLVTAPATCPDCRGQTETIKDLFAEATRQAIAQSAQVRYWPDQPAFQQAGGIAALARF